MERDALRRALERCQDAAITLTPHGEIWSWNGAAVRLFGYSAGEALGRPFATLLQARGPLGKAVDEEYCRLAIREGSVPSFDMLATTSAGREVWTNVTVLVLEAEGMSPAAIVHLTHDITPSKQREALAAQLVETASRLVALSHDAGRPVPVKPLSEQERRILQAFVAGKKAPEVARILKISAQTLRNHLHRINRKLGTHSRLEAVTHAVRRKLV